MALINPQAAAVAGSSPSFGAANASDTFRPSERGLLIYRTAGTASNLTLTIPGNDNHSQARPDVVVAMAATDLKVIPTVGYLDSADANGVVTITSSSQTALTVAYVTN